jgi:hypothetical protein
LGRVYIAALELPDVKPTDREPAIPSVKTPNVSFEEVDTLGISSCGCFESDSLELNR